MRDLACTNICCCCWARNGAQNGHHNYILFSFHFIYNINFDAKISLEQLVSSFYYADFIQWRLGIKCEFVKIKSCHRKSYSRPFRLFRMVSSIFMMH